MLKKVHVCCRRDRVCCRRALPFQLAPASAEAMTCKAAAEVQFPSDRRARHDFKKSCKAAWKATQKA